MGSSCACCKQLLSQLCVAIALAGVVLDIFTAMGRGRYRPCLDCPASNTSGLDWAFTPLALTLSQAFPWLSVSQCCDSAGHDYRYRKRRRGRTPRGFVRDHKFGVTGHRWVSKSPCDKVGADTFVMRQSSSSVYGDVRDS